MHAHRAAPRRAPRRRAGGFTVLEVLIAVILVDVGLLALVGATAALVRGSAALRARTMALHAAEDRLQRLGATPCTPAIGAGAVAAGGPWSMTEQWWIQPLAFGTREIADSVTFVVGTTAKSIVLRTRLPC